MLRLLVAALVAGSVLPAARASSDGVLSSDGLIGKGKLSPWQGKGGLMMGKAAPAFALASAIGKGPQFPPAPADWAAGVCTG